MATLVGTKADQERPAPVIRRPRRKRQWISWGFLAPFAVVFLITFIAPLLYALYLSLFRKQIVGGTTFVGFVGEWRDHGLLSTLEDGTPYYAYGGDFGKAIHDGNFVMDTLILSDGTPTLGLLEFAVVIAPIKFVAFTVGLLVKNP